MALRRIVEAVNGYDFRRPDRVRKLVAEHATEVGLVLWFRYPPRATFGDVAPSRAWLFIGVHLDGEFVRFVGGGRCEPLWVPLNAGAHELQIRRAPPDNEPLAEITVELSDALRVVEVTPATRYEPATGAVRIIDAPGP